MLMGMRGELREIAEEIDREAQEGNDAFYIGGHYWELVLFPVFCVRDTLIVARVLWQALSVPRPALEREVARARELLARIAARRDGSE